MPAKATNSITSRSTINAAAAKPAVTQFNFTDANSYSYKTEPATTVYDSQGRPQQLTQYFVKTDPNKWKVHYQLGNDTPIATTTELEFNTDGTLKTQTNSSIDFSAAPTNSLNGADTLALNFDYSKMSQHGDKFDPPHNEINGYPAGKKTGQRIENGGFLVTTFSNGQRVVQGQVALANFANPNGLTPEGNKTSWSATSASGEPQISAPGTGMAGNIKVGMLENSNVTMSDELVSLMTAQRNYQANTKVISTNDSMMNALFQAL